MGGMFSEPETVYVEKDTSHLDRQINEQKQQISQLVEKLGNMTSSMNNATDSFRRQFEAQAKEAENDRKRFEEGLKQQQTENNKQRDNERKKFEEKLKKQTESDRKDREKERKKFEDKIKRQQQESNRQKEKERRDFELKLKNQTQLNREERENQRKKFEEKLEKQAKLIEQQKEKERQQFEKKLKEQTQQNRKERENQIKHFEETLEKQNMLNEKQREKERKNFEESMLKKQKENDQKLKKQQLDMKLLYEGQIVSLTDAILNQTKVTNKAKKTCDELKKELILEENHIKKFKTERNDPNCKVLKMIGPTGAGKSTFCNRFLGDSSDRGDAGEFRVGHNIVSETESISKTQTTIGGKKYVVIDTPGSADSEGRDKQFMNIIISYLRGCGGINSFLIFFPLVNARLDDNYYKLLDEYQSRMGEKEFWKHVIFIFTKYDMEVANTNERDAKKKAKKIIKKIRMYYDLMKDDDSDDDDDDFEEIKIPHVCIGRDNYTDAIEKLLKNIHSNKFESKELKSPYDDMKNKYDKLVDNYKTLNVKLEEYKQQKTKIEILLENVNKELSNYD